MAEDKKINDRLRWFFDRIGKRVYRNNYCKCETCNNIYTNGIVLDTQEQAEYCYDNEIGFTADGSPMRYFDSIEEMLQFEKQIRKDAKHS